MLLTVDIGNTESVLGWFEDLTPVHTWRIATDRRRTADEIGLQLRGLLGACDLPAPERIVVASVVPALHRVWLAVGGVLDAPLRFLNGGSPIPVRLDVDHPLGRQKIYGMPWKLSKTPGQIRLPATMVGQYNDFAFREVLGMAGEEIDRLAELVAALGFDRAVVDHPSAPSWTSRSTT